MHIGSVHWAVTLGIFCLTYLLIIVQRLPGLKFDRPSGVLIGSTLLLLAGALSLEDALQSIDLRVITFLLGMMIMTAYLEVSGFFEYAAQRLVVRAHSAHHLLILIMISAAFFSALFVNDTICLLFTPIVIRVTRQAKLSPLPFLIALATASNIGSALTITGNPQNMYIGIQSGIPFMRFIKFMSVPVGLALWVNYMLIRLIFRRDLTKKRTSNIAMDDSKVLNKRLCIKTLAALFLTMGLFFVGVSYPLAALVGASLILFFGAISPREAFRYVDWSLLLFFAGLFIVMRAFEKAGLSEALIGTFLNFIEDDWAGILKLSFVSTLLSNLVSNVPAVILLERVVKEMPASGLFWKILAMSSTFAGNLTLIGSVANLIVAEKAEREGIRISFLRYLAIGLPLTVISILIGCLWFIYIWS